MREENPPNRKKLEKAAREFRTYIGANQAFIPNYGDRYRHDETISTAFVESTVNYVVSKRFVKKQQMRWTQRGAHLLLQNPCAGPERRSAENLRPLVSRNETGRTCGAKGGGIEVSAPGMTRSPNAVQGSLCTFTLRVTKYCIYRYE
ncbi:hypothetical protein AYM40_35590 (plasmid) [Paraburkholderia phytofirmans OLGA172]|uniref:Uncharacterized protein n=1 Tax=Paraburkholderia phytofirmans OLGA172 TaxID=1417228 RepID=A0A160FWD7_9BURK|nr:hypothetical protein AYM40_35590 [Paraburkholderia phytofirmans OLGA172]